MSTQIVVPALGESVVEATVGEWVVQEGDRVKTGDILVRLETDKVDLEVSAEQDGVVTRLLRRKGEDVKVGDPLAELAPAGAAAAPAQGATASAPAASAGETQAPAARESAPPTPAAPAAAEDEGDGRSTPLARRIAEERGIDLAQVTGSGPGGRVTREDVERFASADRAAPDAQAAEKPAPAQKQPAAPAARPAPAAEQPPRPEERIRFSRRRQTIARRLVEAQQTAAMLTTFNEIDLSAVIAVRGRRKESFKEQHGVGLGFMSFFVKASIGALKAIPQVNAELQGDELILKHYYDIGIAIGAEDGLVVPVVRDADRLTFAQIERAIQAYAEKARANTLTLEDLRGGTFTITNGGVFGSLMSTPILNPPQVGILGMHKIEPRPIAVDGAVVIRPMMYVALSYDHRVIDGREAVQFLVKIKQLIEDPEALLLEG